MRKVLLLCFLIGGFNLFAQSQWFLNAADEDGKIYYDTVIENAETHFSDIDIYAKGSGYKQFQRWKEIWKYRVKEDGTIPSPKNLIAAWQEKNAFTESQENYETRTIVGEWESLGPIDHNDLASWSPGQGRINIITVDPNDENTIYVGTPDGGLWKSADHGSNWTPLSDNLPSLGISGIVVSHTDSNTIYISTGDEDGFHTFSAGIYKTTDGGLNWEQVLEPDFASGGEIMMHPTNSDILFLATTSGFYKTIDGGDNWTRKFSTSRIFEIRLKPGSPNVVYIVGADQFLYSTDSGENFIETTSTNLFNGASRVAIDVTNANPAYVYALVANANNSFRGVYRSEDSGVTFTRMSPAAANGSFSYVIDGNQAGYDLAIGVSNTNEDLIFTGEINIWGSADGGQNFGRINFWKQDATVNGDGVDGTLYLDSYTHADIHDLKFYNGKLYCGSDGGIYVSDDVSATALPTFTSLTAGLDISQFYRIDTGATTNQIAGGLQDNGAFGYNDNNGIWENFSGADGMDAAINSTNPNLYYVMSQQGGFLNRLNIANNQVERIAEKGQGNWITPMAMNSAGELFAGYTGVFKLNESATDITQAWEQVNTGFMGLSSINHLVIDPSNDDNFWIIVGNYIYKSTNGGVTARQINPFLGDINWIEVHPNDSNLIYVIVGGSNQNGGRGGNAVYKSTNGGNSWVNYTKNLPTSNGFHVIKGQKNSVNNSVYLGTVGGGVYYIDDALDQWTTFNDQLPNVAVRDIEIDEVEGNIVVATFGRGIWRSPVHERSVLNITDTEITNNQNLYIYPNPVENEVYFNFNINESAVIKVFNLTGQLLINKKVPQISNRDSLNLKKFQSGTYIITITSKSHLITKKIIVK